MVSKLNIRRREYLVLYKTAYTYIYHIFRPGLVYMISLRHDLHSTPKKIQNRAAPASAFEEMHTALFHEKYEGEP
jgi:hypothetical protein